MTCEGFWEDVLHMIGYNSFYYSHENWN